MLCCLLQTQLESGSRRNHAAPDIDSGQRRQLRQGATEHVGGRERKPKAEVSSRTSPLNLSFFTDGDILELTAKLD